jgi:hypothetical protein
MLKQVVCTYIVTTGVKRFPLPNLKSLQYTSSPKQCAALLTVYQQYSNICTLQLSADNFRISHAQDQTLCATFKDVCS